MNIQAGQNLLHYRLVDKIGEGGMGVVWKAVDTTLDRTVAIKLLPETLALDAERLGRFEREAKSLAALNNPHIAAIYGLHRVDDFHFIAMEYVEGEDLSQRIKRGPIPVEEAVAIATSIADALSTAHGSGVIHRDLKPANVMLTADGDPKVLDFGLAKVAAPDGSMSGSQTSASPALSPTVTSFGTVAGMILGTAAYMSPEQARGKPVDKRADLWAFGAILYEMLTGKAPFHGETISDTLASVLKLEPSHDALPDDTPPAVRRLVRRCLEKNAKNRLHDAADARIELAQAFDEAESAPASATGTEPTPRSRGPLIAGVIAAWVVGAALGFGLRGGSESAEPPRRLVSAIATPEGVTVNVREISLALSPDGERLAFAGVDEQGQSRLYVRRLDSRDVRVIDGTEGARTPFWSPDALEIGFHTGNRLMRVPAEGGTPQLIAEINGRDGTWSADGTILFGAESNGPLQKVDAAGGQPVPVEGTVVGLGQAAIAPQFLADGRHYIYQREDLGGDTFGVWLGELDTPDTTKLMGGLFNAQVADGHLVFVKDDTLMAQPLDLDKKRLTGEPLRIAGPVLRLNYPFHAFFSVAPSGRRMVYLHGTQAAGLAELVWVDRSGAELSRPGIQGDLYNPQLSPDGRRLAIDVSTAETHGDIWVFDLARGSSTRLTRDPVDESLPQWTPDGERIVFFRVPDLYEIDASGASEERRIHSDGAENFSSDISGDGRFVLFTSQTDGPSDIRVLDRESGEARDWLATEFTEEQARFSPDGRWVAYVSDETGRPGVYVDRFPDRGERFRISTEGGSWPRWRRDGRELFWASDTGDLMVVALDMDSDRDPVGVPQKLFSTRLRRDYFDVTPDGERFLLVQRIDPEIDAITLIQNWAEGAGD